MKRWISIIVALLLLFPLSCTLSESNTYSAALSAAVKAYLDSQGYTYDYDSENCSFDYGMSLDSTLSSCDMRISIREDGFSVFAFSPDPARPRTWKG